MEQHLTVDEILDFVSMTEFNDESIKLAAAVNGHIRKCGKCMELVRAFQLIYDEFVSLNIEGGFKDFLSENIDEIKKDKEQSAEVAAILDEIEELEM